jgi:hypothetical protein
MWRLVREGLRVYAPVLVMSWGYGLGILLLVTTIVSIVGSVKDIAEIGRFAQHAPVAILIASMVAAFIVTGTERGESRVRMYVMLPLPIGQVARARVVLPALMILLGLAVSHVVFGALLAFRGTPFAWRRHFTVDVLALLLFFWPQFALAVREVIELRGRTSWRGALGAKSLLAVAVALVVVLQLPQVAGAGVRAAALAALDLGLMAFSVSLFVRRTQFTK